MRETLTDAGKLGLRLLEDLTALAAGGSVCEFETISSLTCSITFPFFLFTCFDKLHQ